MSLYELLGVSTAAGPRAIARALETRQSALVPEAVLADVVKRGGPHTLPNGLLEAMHGYLNTVGNVLLDPDARSCYDSYCHALSRPTVQSHTLTTAKLKWHNRFSRVQFGEKVFDALPASTDIDTQFVQTTRKRVLAYDYRCRWCAVPLDIEHKQIFQCKCTARIGHRTCATKFAKEYNNTCPVCRSSLLKRSAVSKYMFWCIDDKFKL